MPEGSPGRGQRAAANRQDPRNDPAPEGLVTAGPLPVFRLAESALGRAAIVAALWVVIGILDAERTYVALRLAGRENPLPSVLGQSLASVAIWAAFTPLVVRAARYWRLEREGWPRRVPVHAGLALGFALLDVMLDRAAAPLVEGSAGYGVTTRFFYELLVNAGSYAAIVAIVHAADYAVAYRERRAAVATLAAELAQARFLALRAQLQPHFLFNTLNSIAELVHADPEAAGRMVTHLGLLLRRSIEAGPDVPLRSEIDMLDAYLDIMRTRLGGRVVTTTRIQRCALDVRVPALVLQPLVENAFRHGIEPNVQSGRIEISARCVNRLLELVVRDNGRGFAAGRAVEGLGLLSVRRRLECLYPGRFELMTENAPDGGAVVRIRVPLDRTPTPTATGGA